MQATSAGDAVLLGSDGKVPSSLQATDMTLSLDPETKVLTVTVNGVNKTVDLSGIGGGMKQVIKSYTSYSKLYSDLSAGNIPAGADIFIEGNVGGSSSNKVSCCIRYIGDHTINSPGIGGGSKSSVIYQMAFGPTAVTAYYGSSNSSAIVINHIKVIYWE